MKAPEFDEKRISDEFQLAMEKIYEGMSKEIETHLGKLEVIAVDTMVPPWILRAAARAATEVILAASWKVILKVLMEDAKHGQ